MRDEWRSSSAEFLSVIWCSYFSSLFVGARYKVQLFVYEVADFIAVIEQFGNPFIGICREVVLEPTEASSF